MKAFKAPSSSLEDWTWYNGIQKLRTGDWDTPQNLAKLGARIPTIHLQHLKDLLVEAKALTMEILKSDQAFQAAGGFPCLCLNNAGRCSRTHLEAFQDADVGFLCPCLNAGRCSETHLSWSRSAGQFWTRVVKPSLRSTSWLASSIFPRKTGFEHIALQK